VVRISVDAKDKVNIGNLSRGGKSRQEVKTDDHDSGVIDTITPFGVYVPKGKDLTFYMVRSKVTGDCCVDIINSWWSDNQHHYEGVKKLVINLDNGPDQHSYRTQFVKRIQEFSNQTQLEVHLAYYPPYHSKYNPVEHTFGSLEQYWSGEVLDTEKSVIKYAESMTYAGKHPTVSVVSKIYNKGVKVKKKIIEKIHAGLERTKGIEKYSVLFKPRLDSG